MKKLFFVLSLFASTSCDEEAVSVGSINESKMLDINDTKQFVMIRGGNANNPVLLHLHGGPGVSELSGFRKYNRDLEKDFTVVYWDQRVAGKSFVANSPVSEIKVSKYVENVNELAKYLKKRLNVNKLVL